MAHFAEINKDNFVERVIVIKDDFDDNELEGQSFCQRLTGSTNRWIKTSYNGSIRFNYAGIGFYYDEVNDAFISPKPFDSWILDNNFKWKAPVDHPNVDALYSWDEETLSWIPY